MHKSGLRRLSNPMHKSYWHANSIVVGCEILSDFRKENTKESEETKTKKEIHSDIKRLISEGKRKNRNPNFS